MFPCKGCQGLIENRFETCLVQPCMWFYEEALLYLLLQNGAFHPKPTENPVIRVRPQCVCSTVKQVPMCCVDEDGKLERLEINCGYYFEAILGLEHHVLLHCCECEPVTVTMVRARL